MRILVTLLLVATLAWTAPIVRAEEEPAVENPLEKALENPPATGLIVTTVSPGSQAAERGVRPGDVIVSYGGKEVATLEALHAAKAEAEGQEKLEMVLVRQGGERVTVELEPGQIGINLIAAKEGEPVAPLPPATDVAFDFSSLAEAPHDDWYAFTLGDGEKVGFEHGTLKLEDGKLIVHREVAFDGGEQYGVNHFYVEIVATTEAQPRTLSLRFEVPIGGFVSEGSRKEEEDGTHTWQVKAHASQGEGRQARITLPTDLPVIPTYLVEPLASFMPRKTGTCLHYRPQGDARGDIMLPAGLYVAGEEEIEIQGEKHKTWKIETRELGGGVGSTFWVDGTGHVLKAHYGGPVSIRTTKEKALADLHHGIQPKTAD